MDKFSAVVSFFLVMATALPALAQTCPLTRRVYRNVNERGFVLEFRPAPPNSAIVSATAIVSQDVRGIIFKFELVRSQGYGSYNLVQGKEAYPAYFFDKDGKQFNRDGTPPLLFVSGLGSADYYLNQTKGGRTIFMGDNFWQFAYCRSGNNE
jgi:hypothetical protein